MKSCECPRILSHRARSAPPQTESGAQAAQLPPPAPGTNSDIDEAITGDGVVANQHRSDPVGAVDVMRDYGYLEHMGLGVPRKIVRGMQEFNGSQPEFVVGEESLTVVLRREPVGVR